MFYFYPLFIHCINTQRGCHTLKLPSRCNRGFYCRYYIRSAIKTSVASRWQFIFTYGIWCYWILENICVCLRTGALTTHAIGSITECSSEVDVVLCLARGPTGLEFAACICKRTGGAFKFLLCVCVCVCVCVEGITAMLQEDVYNFFFYIYLLTVHLGTICVNNQLDTLF